MRIILTHLPALFNSIFKLLIKFRHQPNAILLFFSICDEINFINEKYKTWKIEEEENDLVERRARTNRGGPILNTKAVSRSFQALGTLLDQQIWDTRSSATSVDGIEMPAELRLEESSMAHTNGSVFLSWANFVSSITLSHWLECTVTVSMDSPVRKLDSGGLRRQLCRSQSKLACWKHSPGYNYLG